jgi:hypothetical protein
MAILGGYTGMVLLYQMSSAIGGSKKKKSKPVDAVVAAPVAASDGNTIPSIESNEFNTFLESIAFEKLLENDASLTKVIESAA